MPPTITLPADNPLTALIDGDGIWLITIFLGCSIILQEFIIKVTTYKNWAQRILWVYVLNYALYLFMYPVAHFGVYTTAYQVTAGQALIEAFLIPIGAAVFQKTVFKALPTVIVIELACVWLHRGGLMLASSFSLAFAALALPFLPWWLRALTVFSVLTHHASTALLVLWVQLGAFTLKNKRFWPLFTAVTFAFLVMTYFQQGGGFFHGSGRVGKYNQFMTFWATNPKWVIFGVGPGSFMWTSLLMDKFKGELFLQMHSDWLQILWEYGLVGFLLSVAVFIGAAKDACKNPRSLAAVFGAGAFMLTYHPLHFFPTALLIAVIYVSRKDSCPSRPH